MSANGFGGEGLVNDVLECFGDLDSILSLPGGDEMNSMSCVGRGELGRMTTWRLLKGRTMLGVKSKDGAGVEASGG